MINEVRNTVLSVLNKNNYGYISPSDFNLYALNAQMEIFEDYFSGYNKAINAENARAAGSDYAEVEGPIAETIEGFLVTNFLSNPATTPSLPGSNSFSVPSVTTTGNTAYYILKMLCHTNIICAGTNDVVGLNVLKSSSGQFTDFEITPGDIVVNVNTRKTARVVFVSSDTTIVLDSNIFLTAPVNYLIISQAAKEAEKVSVGKITMLNSSLLTQPNNMFPSYTLEGDYINIYPKTINQFGQVEADYFRHPLPPKWTYITLANGEPVFDQSQSDYQDFELPYEDTYRLVMKILQYCGISIREAEVTQFSMVQEQQNNLQ
jgi:hypothetical protein